MSECRTLSSIEFVFLKSYSCQPSSIRVAIIHGSLHTYNHDDSTQVSSDPEMTLGHFLAIRNDDGASNPSCIVAWSVQSMEGTIHIPSLLTIYLPKNPVAPKTVTVCPVTMACLQCPIPHSEPRDEVRRTSKRRPSTARNLESISASTAPRGIIGRPP